MYIPEKKKTRFLCIRSTLLAYTDTFGTSTCCPSYRESNIGGKESQGPPVCVRFTEVFVKRVEAPGCTLLFFGHREYMYSQNKRNSGKLTGIHVVQRICHTIKCLKEIIIVCF